MRTTDTCFSPNQQIVMECQPTVGDKIVETLYSNMLTSENKRIHTPPLSPPFKVGVFVVFCRQLEQRHNIAWRGWGGKDIFPTFEVSKKAQFRARCLNSFCSRLQLMRTLHYQLYAVTDLSFVKVKKSRSVDSILMFPAPKCTGQDDLQSSISASVRLCMQF